MYKRVLIGLLAVSVVAIWGSAAQAFNRINGIIIRHSSIEADVRLCGDPLVNTQLTLLLEGVVEIACANPGGHVPNGNPGHPTVAFNFQESKVVSTGNMPTGDFNPSDTCDSGNNNNATATIEFMFNLPEVSCKPNWTMVPGSQRISVAAMATWSCTGTGPECQNAGDTIEAIRVECADIPPSGEEDPGVLCNDSAEHVGEEGAPPPPLPDDAYYDFQAWVSTNGEKGFKNSSPFTDTKNGLTLTATAFESPYNSASHVYMDGFSHPSIGGMGVCSVLNVYKQCTPSSDDSVSNGEILRWTFSHNITQVTLELGNGLHATYANGAFRYQYGSQGWVTATTNGSGEITLMFDGTSKQLEFKTVAGAASESKFFYIRNATVTYTP